MSRPETSRSDYALASGEYKMDHPERGIAIVINIINFDDEPDMKRNGSDRDVESITDALQYLGFQVTIHQDKTALEILSILSNVATKVNHTNNDCFVCVVMSHGAEAGILGKDGEIVSENDLCKPFKDTPSLKDKPKLFFIQACRGEVKMDHAASSKEQSEERSFFRSAATMIESDSLQYKQPPSEVDFLIHISTVQSNVSWRNPLDGSLFIQSLSTALKEKATGELLMDVLTFVNNQVVAMHREKESDMLMPEIKHRLRGRITFSLKNKLVEKFYANGRLMYNGECKDDKRHGQGTCYWEDGSIEYEGEWKDDKMNGQGKYYYEDGRRYVGEWKDGMRHGIGKVYLANGDWYEGEFKDDKVHGQGKEYYKDGSIQYDGEFKDGSFNGQGKYYWEDGTRYVGEWKDDQKHGQGKYYHANGGWYEGEFKDDKVHGQGKEYYKDGSIQYDGEWKDDKKHGHGKYYWENGHRFEGEYKDDQRNGHGTYYWEDGSIAYVGDCKDDNKHGQGKYYFANGDWYEGEFKDDKKHGHGTCYYTTGNRYEGEWRDDKKHGQGKYYHEDDDSVKYVGEWKDDKANGQGTFYFPNDQKYEGEFKNG